MSRIKLQPLNADDHPDREIYVGWERGAQTFFAYVMDPDENLALDVGNDYQEISEVGTVIDDLRPYAVIPDDLEFRLGADQFEDTATLPMEAGEVARQALQGNPVAQAALLGLDPADTTDETDDEAEDDSLNSGLGY